jgi:hypothetical protein
MATTLKPPATGELARLRGLVADQYRRLAVVRGELGAPDAADVVVEPLPSRCPKPRLTPTALARLMEEARARLELIDTTLGASLWSAWPERRPTVPVLRPTPGLAAYGLRLMPGLPNLVVALFGRQQPEIAAAVARVLAEQRGEEPFLPVFLTNHPDFGPLREQRLAFEYFPFELDQAAPAPDPRWAAYFVATLELTMRRWGVRQVVML